MITQGPTEVAGALQPTLTPSGAHRVTVSKKKNCPSKLQSVDPSGAVMVSPTVTVTRSVTLAKPPEFAIGVML
jgi:hypothetical protein